MPDEVFLAFEREKNRGSVGRLTLEAAVNPDIYGDIDARNNWTEPEEPRDAIAEATEICKQESARAVNEFLRFVFQDIQLDRRGDVHRAIIRFVAIAHHVNAAQLSHGCSKHTNQHEDPLTIRELARLHQLRCPPRELRAAWREFRKLWPFTCHVAPITRSKARR